MPNNVDTTKPPCGNCEKAKQATLCESCTKMAKQCESCVKSAKQSILCESCMQISTATDSICDLCHQKIKIEASPHEPEPKARVNVKRLCCVVGGGLFAMAAPTLILPALGFGAGGVIAGSIAASIQGPAVAAGSKRWRPWCSGYCISWIRHVWFGDS